MKNGGSTIRVPQLGDRESGLIKWVVFPKHEFSEPSLL